MSGHFRRASHLLIKGRFLSIQNTHKGQDSSKKYNFGIIGCGRIAGVHLKQILKHPRIQVKWVLEENQQRIQEVKRQFSLNESVPFLPYSKKNELLQDKSLDAVTVFSPISTHFKHICDSLKNGKAVFTEKPLAESLEEIRTCYETAEKHGQPLLVGFMRRFDDAYSDVKNAIASGKLGTVHVIKITSRDSPKPSYDLLESLGNTGCNIFADMAIHDIDMLTWLTKAERPESIYVNCHIHDPVLVKSGEPDTMIATLKYPSGILVTMDISWEAVYGYDMRLEVFGSGGMATVENPRESSTVIDGVRGGTLSRLLKSFPERFEKAFEKELDHFILCLDGKATPLITKQESERVAEIIEKGILAYKQRQVVTF